MKIHLINDGVSRPVDALITARIREGLDSEFTLSFTLTENDTPHIHDNTIVQYGEQYFSVVSYQKDREGRSPTCTAECEHVSYCLNDEAYELEEFVYSGSAAGALKAILNGTPLSAGTVELSGTVNIRLTGGTRKAILLSVAAIIGGEIEYSGYTVNLCQHRGSTDYIELLGTDNVTDVSYSRDVLNGTTAYNVQLGRKTILSCGDNVHIRFTPLDIDVQTRITAIEYNPYNTNEVEIEVGDYVPDILDTLQKTQKKTDTALKDAETAKKTASETAASLSEYTKKSEISAEVNKYLDSETG
ncbi:MAG: phage tail protein, partial [Clostridia bacterium]|nr:phage tail protein [Clostridia bacterium]